VLATTVELAPSLDIKGYDGKRTDGLIATASKNPDGSHVVVLFNQTAKPIDYQVELGGTVAEGKIDAQALQTLVWTTGD
jgi:hypothetical protein